MQGQTTDEATDQTLDQTTYADVRAFGSLAGSGAHRRDAAFGDSHGGRRSGARLRGGGRLLVQGQASPVTAPARAAPQVMDCPT
jgi:hypothetical protein